MCSWVKVNIYTFIYISAFNPLCPLCIFQWKDYFCGVLPMYIASIERGILKIWERKIYEGWLWIKGRRTCRSGNRSAGCFFIHCETIWGNVLWIFFLVLSLVLNQVWKESCKHLLKIISALPDLLNQNLWG